MLRDRDISKLIKAEIANVRCKIDRLEKVLLDPKKSASERIRMLATTLELGQKKLKGESPRKH